MAGRKTKKSFSITLLHNGLMETGFCFCIILFDFQCGCSFAPLRLHSDVTWSLSQTAGLYAVSMCVCVKLRLFLSSSLLLHPPLLFSIFQPCFSSVSCLLLLTLFLHTSPHLFSFLLSQSFHLDMCVNLDGVALFAVALRRWDGSWRESSQWRAEGTDAPSER